MSAVFNHADEVSPTASRPCADAPTKGDGHAKSHDQCFELLDLSPGRRQRESAEVAEHPAESLTQQATNNTCVTARRDGQPFNHADPEVTAQRRARIELATVRSDTRLDLMVNARRTLRECEILRPWELLAALNNIDAAMARHVGPSNMTRYRAMVNAVCCDIETELTDADSLREKEESHE